ncbi:MAG: hypothetical protein ACYTGH_14880 [Planctomycetota bacterium]|jgi:hypothetical protein
MMSEATIHLSEDRTNWYPGEILSGTVTWTMEKAPKQAKLRLYWRTSGKGTKDREVVRSLTLDAPAAQESRNFEIQLPLGPYSFDGRLISLDWGIELRLDDTRSRKPFTLSMNGEPVELCSEGARKRARRR